MFESVATDEIARVRIATPKNQPWQKPSFEHAKMKPGFSYSVGVTEAELLSRHFDSASVA